MRRDIDGDRRFPAWRLNPLLTEPHSRYVALQGEFDRFTDQVPRPNHPGAPRQRARSRCVGAHLIVFSACSYSRSERLSRLIMARLPPFQALRDTTAFPLEVLGPVDFSQGRHRWISSACLARRSGVQPLAILLLQYFVMHSFFFL